jgi:signal transduction histidine kinase/DNA-binding response OmpR family regulator
MELKNGRFSYLDNESGAVMLASQYDRTVVFTGLADGVVVLKFIDGRWRSLGRIQGIVADVGEMNEDASGNLWLGTFSEGAIRLQFSGEGPDKYLRPAVSHFGPAHGLPVGYLQLNRIGDELVFRVEPHATLYQFNVREERFHRLSSPQVSGKAAGDSITLRPSIPDYDSATQYPLTGEKDGKLWMIRRRQHHAFDVIRLARNGAQYQKHTVPFARVREDFDEVVYEDDNGDIWMGGLDGILRYDQRAHGPSESRLKVIVNGIMITNDSTLHNGMHTVTQHIALPYDLNSITFSYGATSFDLREETEFQYLLEGFDKDWSAWGKQQMKSYTQVPEGNYVFNVRARNIYGHISPTSAFAFSIAPPWHRHVIAYVCYALLFCGMIYGAVVLRSRKLEKDKEALMRIIDERTTEISTKNAQLEQQAEELKAQTEQLREMDKAKSAFFTNISHEFRTPLSLILAPLEKDIADGSASPESAIMYRNARRLQGLINQLLDLSRLESGEMKVFLCRNDLTAFAQAIVTSFEALAESRNIGFIVSIPPAPLDGYFDPDKLETVLYNLLSNAFKFTPEGGSVSFAMDADTGSQQCAFTVTDTGGGIPPAELGRIFDRFYQVESGVRRSFEGSGIGLALTRELVVLMQGNITVDSPPGAGSSFRVSLPFSHGESTIDPEEIAMTFGPATAGPSALKDTTGDNESHQNMETTILLVEDNVDLNAYLTSILNKTYNVITAYNGEDALRIALAEMPDLILSDMMMPRMDGFALCEEIRKDAVTSHIPFILLTARTSIESRLAGLELGADDYLTKPFVVAELIVRVRNLLHQRKQLQARFRQELTVAPRNITVTSADEAFLRKVMEVTEARMKDASFSVERLGEEIGISRKHLHRKLVAIVGQTPNEFIRIFRLKTAMQLLQQQSGSVKEVAFGVGFSNLSYFAKCFKEEFGMSPAEVKAQNA